ncbi:MAG: class I SAM-dependent methyltransferase [Xanthomonadales bacterium]|nr:class I SAM-dependent methyltransferase [Xanthomonadales bacterium]
MSAVQVPPSWRHVGRHALFPEAGHDDVARFDFLANLNTLIASEVLPALRQAYEQRTKPAFVRTHGRPPGDRHEAHEALRGERLWQIFGALRRASMEMRQQTGRTLVLRQLPQLLAKARALNEGAPTLRLDPSIEQPRYASAVDIHCMPGGYHGELVPEDVSAGANYDCGLFATTAGMLGRYSDGGGRALAAWLRAEHPDFRPRRILDLGCTVGHNVVPLAQAFPDAEVVAVDTAAPVLRYGHARARSLGVRNLCFVQANAECLPFPDAHFELVTSAMFWHETSARALPRILAEVHRLLAPGGLTLHLEQPQYTPEMDPFEQAMRDWDAHYNNEPFWSAMHELDPRRMLVEAGFRPADCFEFPLRAEVDREVFPEAGTGQEDYGRTPLWTVFGAWKRD